MRDDIVLVAIDDKTFDRDEYGSAFPFTRNYHADVIEQVSRGEPRRDRLRRPVHGALGRPGRRRPPVPRRPGRRQRRPEHDGDAPRTARRTSSAASRRRRRAGVTVGNGLFDEDPGGVIRRVQERINGLDTLSVAAVRRLGLPVHEAPLQGDGRGSTTPGPAGHVPALHVLRRRAGRGRPRDVPRQDRRRRRDRAGAAGHPSRLVARRPHAGAGGPRERDRDAARRRAAAVHRATGVDLALALAARAARPARRAPAPRLARARDHRRGGRPLPRRRPARSSTRAGSSPWSRRWRRWRRASSARCSSSGSAPRSSARARATCSPASCPTRSSTRCSRGRRRRATRAWAARRWTRRSCSATCAASRRSPRRAPPEQVIDILNRYLTAMSDAILDHGGTLVAYMGDGIMAVFGAPVAAERPPGPGARRRPGDARPARGVQRLDARARARRRLQDGHRAALRAR